MARLPKYALLAAAVGTIALVGAGFYLDYKRTADPKYKKKVAMKKKQEAFAAEPGADSHQQSPQPADQIDWKEHMKTEQGIRELQAIFLREVDAGQTALINKDIHASVKHFVDAIHIFSLYDDVRELLRSFRSAFPVELYQLIVSCCDPALLRDRYYDDYPPAALGIRIAVGQPSSESASDAPRSVVTTKAFVKGQTIHTESPFVSMVLGKHDQTQYCGNCRSFLAKENLAGKEEVEITKIPCKNACGTEFYCSQTCRDTAFLHAHYIFCYTKDESMSITTKSEAAISATNSNTNSGTNSDNKDGRRKAIDAYLGRIRSCEYTEMQLVASILSQIFSPASAPSIRSMVQDIERMMMDEKLVLSDRVREEAVILREAIKLAIPDCEALLAEDNYLRFMSRMEINQLPYCSTSAEPTAPITGFGLYKLGSYFNHSFAPNISIKFTSTNEIKYVATTDIPADTELTRDYTEHLNLAAGEKHEFIRNRYHFECPPDSLL